MIILITGSSHVGKTVLAQKMLEKYKYPYLSIDHLKMGLIRSGYTTLTPEDDDALTDYLWPVVREMIKTAIENEQNLIIEGCYIPADWRQAFDDDYLKHIQFICLAMSEQYIEDHFDEIIEHESDIETRLVDSDCTMDELKQCNRRYIDTFESAGEKVVLIESNFEKVLTEILEVKSNVQIVSELKPDLDPALADLIRSNLKKHHLDIPGTVYFDDNLNHLSDYYLADPAGRYYYVVTDDNDRLVGGIGLAEFEFYEDCCELQKLYLADEVKGAGLSYKLISMIEDKAKELGYKRMYLETHDNLAAAIHVYQKCGYIEIDKPAGIVHATMNRFFIKELK